MRGEEGTALIGISWRSTNPLAGPEKSIALSPDWYPVLQQKGVRFVSLQYGDVTEELAEVQREAGIEILCDPSLDPTRDVDGFAALVAAMDLVISTSNTTVHVAGGMGIPTWILVPPAYGRPWYWFEKGETSPWYPGVRLLRSQGDWRALMTQAAENLAQWKDQ
jgi:hypothetical protein